MKEDLETSTSSIEELVSEPDGKNRGSRLNLDTVFGLLVLGGLLVWALWMWWHDTDAGQHYQQAQQAASARHWDDALANYSAASGYLDADSRAVDAAGQVKKRDSQYQTVVSYTKALNAPEGASSADAVVALLAARTIQTIEPGYKDTEAVISHSEDQLFTDALSGTIVMREQAEPPGLYYRGPGGWVHMEGSDKESQVLGTVSDTYIAYDAPNSYTTFAISTPFAGITPTGVSTQALAEIPNKTGRHVVLAKLSIDHKQASFQNLHLTPTQDREFIFGELGVWTLSRYGSPADGPGIGYYWNYDAGSFMYQAYGGNPVTGTVALPAKDVRIVDMGRKGSIILIAATGQKVNNKLTNVIYAAGPDGGNATAIYSTTGLLMSAFLSPDERYVLVASADQDGAALDRVLVTANLVDLQPSGQSPINIAFVTVARTVVTGSLSLGDTAASLGRDFYLGGIFLADGAFKNKLLLGWVNENSIRLRLVDPSNAQVPLAETSIGYLNTPYYKAPVTMQAAVQSDGWTLLVYNSSQPLTQTSNAPGEPFTSLVKAFKAQTQTGIIGVSDYAISLPQDYIPADKVPYLSDIEFSSADPVCEITTGMDHTVYGLPTNGASEATQIVPTRVITIPLYSSQASGSPVYWLKGPRALVYVDNANELRVRPYDSETDVTLESGVSSMVSIHGMYLYNSVLR